MFARKLKKTVVTGNMFSFRLREQFKNKNTADEEWFSNISS